MSRHNTGEIVLRTRKEKGITRRQLSEMSGVSVNTIKTWEQGVSTMTIENADKVFKALGVAYIIGDKNNLSSKLQ